MLIYTYTYIYWIHTDAMNNDEWRLLYKYMYLSLYCKNRTAIYWPPPHSYGRQRCVFLVLQGCSTGGPEAHSAGWWLSLLHLISNFSGSQLIRAPRAPWAGLLYHILSSNSSNLQLSPTDLTSVLTELYNSSTPVKEFQVLLFNTNNSIHNYSFLCTQLKGFKYSYVILTIQSFTVICLHTVK